MGLCGFIRRNNILEQRELEAEKNKLIKKTETEAEKEAPKVEAPVEKEIEAEKAPVEEVEKTKTKTRSTSKSAKVEPLNLDVPYIDIPEDIKK